MISELSGVTIVIIIAMGVLLLVLLFIFAKRQIMRFTLRSRRGPHVPVGHDAPRSLRREIERRLDLVSRIKYEPRLLPDGADSIGVVHAGMLCRMQAVDDIKVLETQLRCANEKAVRQPGENLRAFLIGQLQGVLRGCSAKSVHQLCDSYERARFSPEPFSSRNLDEYRQLLAGLVQVAQSNKGTKASTSPKLMVKGKRNQRKDHQVTSL